MQIQMTFLEPQKPDSAALVWATLDDEQRRRVIEALTRLIAKVGRVGNDAASTRKAADGHE